MTTELELANQNKAVARTAQKLSASPSEMMQLMIAKGITQENVAAFKELVVLSERMEDRNAKREFASAFHAMQKDIPSIKAIRAVPDKQGGVKYKYAPYSDIMDKVQPLLDKHGFSIRFSSRNDGKCLTMVCTLTHVGGHSESNEFTNRIGAGPYGATETQADGAAGTSAQRNALCDMLNIVIRHDDPRALGDLSPVSKDQADELERRVKETNSNVPAFLKFAGAKSFAEIPATKYDSLDQMLRRKEKPGR